MKKTITLNKNQLRALKEYMSSNPCSSWCAYEEMAFAGKGCDKCKLTQAQREIYNMLVAE